ncbi:TAXI family TRAP transporter solute-binding subunit [Brevibacterium litoralis]|uniref:TAXI family TRAP transporter solute-binding subunit n=1 Tax=Brevibacterium litoralis TaxID=3138935 RepID=UPI0032EB958E
MRVTTPAHTTRTRRATALTASAAAAALLLSACGGGSGGGGESAGEGGGDLDASFITIATGGSSGVYYQVGATVSEMLADNLGSDTSVQSTGASVENINLITSGDAELAFAQGDASTQAMEGTGAFDGKEPKELMAIGSMYNQYVQIVAMADAGIESIEDLAGKTVSVGDINSGVELNARTVLEAYDMSYDDFTADYLSYSEAIDQMRNGQVDAAFVTSGLPNSAVLDISSTDDVDIVPVDGDGKQTLLDSYGYFGDGSIPADVYEQDADVETITIPNVLLVSTELSEDAVYDITATLFDDLDTLHASHNAAADITPETVTEGLTVPMHPGAQRYFEEQGVDVG